MSFKNKSRAKRSRIWLLPEEEFKYIVENSSTMGKVLSHFGLENKGGNHRTFKDRMLQLGYDVTSYARNGKQQRNVKLRLLNTPQSLEEILVEFSTYSRSSLKKRLIKENLLPYICSLCMQLPEWYDSSLVLILDHINGISNDNRLENLRFLCPNCNSQQATFAGRNKRESFKRVCT